MCKAWHCMTTSWQDVKTGWRRKHKYHLHWHVLYANSSTLYAKLLGTRQELTKRVSQSPPYTGPMGWLLLASIKLLLETRDWHIYCVRVLHYHHLTNTRQHHIFTTRPLLNPPKHTHTHTHSPNPFWVPEKQYLGAQIIPCSRFAVFSIVMI